MENAQKNLRKALHRRDRADSISLVARDCGISTHDLDRYIYHSGSLEPETLNKLVAYAFERLMRLDIEEDRLIPVAQPEPAQFAPAGMTDELPMKPMLSKAERLMPAGALRPEDVKAEKRGFFN